MEKSFKVIHSAETNTSILVNVPNRASVCITKHGIDSSGEIHSITSLDNSLLANKPTSYLKFAKDSLITQLPRDLFKKSNIKESCLPMLMKPEDIHPRLFQAISLDYITVEPESAYFERNEDGMMVSKETLFFCNRDASLVNISDGLSTIYASAFFNCDLINTISIPRSVTKIYPEAFRNCINLKIVSFESGSMMKKLNCDTFMECNNLKEIRWNEPSLLVEIKKGALRNLHSLECVMLPSSIEIISEEAFMKCRKLKNINFKDCIRLRTIQNNAFNQTGVESIQFSPSLQEIGSYSFFKCQNLYQIIFPPDSNLILIEIGAFVGCISMKNIDFPRSLMKIGDNAFAKLNIEGIAFPNDSQINTIGDNAFRYTKLKRIDFPESLEYIGHAAFMNCAQIIDISFPYRSNIRVFGSNSFLHTSIKTLRIPDSVVTIGKKAFQGNMMERVIIGNNSRLNEVGENAFYMNDIKEENIIAPMKILNTFKPKIVTNRQADDDIMFAELCKVSNNEVYSSKEEYAWYNQLFLKYNENANCSMHPSLFYETYRKAKEFMSKRP